MYFRWHGAQVTKADPPRHGKNQGRDSAGLRSPCAMFPSLFDSSHHFKPLSLLRTVTLQFNKRSNNEKLFWLDRGIHCKAFRKRSNSNSRSISELLTIKSQSWRLTCAPHTLGFVKRLWEKEVPFVCPSYWQLRKIHFKVLRWVYWLAINANKAEVSLPCAALVIFISSSISP